MSAKNNALYYMVQNMYAFRATCTGTCTVKSSHVP